MGPREIGARGGFCRGRGGGGLGWFSGGVGRCEGGDVVVWRWVGNENRNTQGVGNEVGRIWGNGEGKGNE